MNNNCIDEESVSQRRPGVVLDKSHQESKSDQHHDIDVLIHRVVVGVSFRIVMNLGSYKDAINDNNDKLQYEEGYRKQLSVVLMSCHKLIKNKPN